MEGCLVIQLFILLCFVQAISGQACSSVDDDERDDCANRGTPRDECVDTDCCWDDSEPRSVWCFKRTAKKGANEQVIRIGGLRITLPDFEGCRLGTIFQEGKNIVDSFIRIARSRNVGDAIRNVLSSSRIFTVGAYCGLFANAVDAITGCIRPFISPFAAIFPTVGTTFFSIMNALEVVKAPCQILSGVGVPLSTVQCIPAAAKICPLNSVEVLTAFESFDTTNIEDTCASFERSLTGVVDCIEEATEGCPQNLKDEFKGVMNVYLDITDISDEYCTSGCYDYILFIADEHPTCTWNLPRIYPNPKIGNYCEYAHYAVECAWLLHSGCPLLPEEIFQRAISGLDIALNAGGCLPVQLDDYERIAAFQIKLPVCVEASIFCGQNLLELIGVTTLAGPFGGYTAADVKDTVEGLGRDIKKGNYGALCGSESQRDDNANPIRDCITDLTDSCKPDNSESKALQIAETAAEWYGEVCVPGCYELAQDFLDFSSTCRVEINNDELISLENILDKLLRAQILGDVESVEECRIAREYVSCVGERIQECTFLHNRLSDARRVVVEAILGPGVDLTRTYEICGIVIDYPFRTPNGGTLFRQVNVGGSSSRRNDDDDDDDDDDNTGHAIQPHRQVILLTSCLSLSYLCYILIW